MKLFCVLILAILVVGSLGRRGRGGGRGGRGGRGKGWGSVGKKKNFCRSDSCTDRCFGVAETEEQEVANRNFYDIVQAVRGARLSQQADGTVFFVDTQVTDEALFEQQRRLAALIALLENAGCEQNPTAIVSYTDSIAYALDDGSCGESTCAVANSLLSLPSQTAAAASAAFVGGACAVGNAVTDCSSSDDVGGEVCGQEVESCGQDRIFVNLINSEVADEGLQENCFGFGPGVIIKSYTTADGPLPTFDASPNTGRVVEIDSEVVDETFIEELLDCVADCSRCELDFDGDDGDETADVTFVTADDSANVQTEEGTTLQDFIANFVNAEEE